MSTEKGSWWKRSVIGALGIGVTAGAAQTFKGEEMFVDLPKAPVANPEPEIPGEKVEVKLAPTAEESITPVNLKESEGSRVVGSE